MVIFQMLLKICLSSFKVNKQDFIFIINTSFKSLKALVDRYVYKCATNTSSEFVSVLQVFLMTFTHQRICALQS